MPGQEGPSFHCPLPRLALRVPWSRGPEAAGQAGSQPALPSPPTILPAVDCSLPAQQPLSWILSLLFLWEQKESMFLGEGPSFVQVSRTGPAWGYYTGVPKLPRSNSGIQAEIRVIMRSLLLPM